MTSGARRVIFGIKLSEDEAADCDAKRGKASRSEWGRALLLAAAVPGKAHLSRPAPAPVAERPKVSRTPAADIDCPHPKGRRLKGGTYCPACGTGGLT